MSRREYTTAFRCKEPGCPDVQRFVHSTREDEKAALRRQRDNPYRCSRHADPARNLRPGNEHRTCTLVATGRPNLPGKLFWVAEGAETGSGYAFGPGFNAYASDFPEGTRLMITAEILAPVAAGS